MRLRRFEGATVTEALARVRADLGPDAVILHARTPEGAGVGGARPARVEVMAAVDDDSRRQPAPQRDDGWSDDARSALPTASRRAIEALEGDEDGTASRMDEMYRMLLELRDEALPAPRMSAALRPLYAELCRRELPQAVARKLLADLPPSVRSSRSGPRRPAVQSALSEAFRVQGMPQRLSGRRVVALVGPTGVGKTTTIAKLAGQFRRDGGMRVALLSLDTYRIGAMAQMGIYAELLGAPLHVVRTRAEFRRALEVEAAADLVLVDSMGRSPRHQEGIASLAALLRDVRDLEVHLVVSATTKGSDLEEVTRRFRPLRYQHVLITKLDEAQSPGPVLGLVLQHDLSVSYLATGQEVPDDLETATPERLAGFLLPSGSGSRPRAVARA